MPNVYRGKHLAQIGPKHVLRYLCAAILVVAAAAALGFYLQSQSLHSPNATPQQNPPPTENTAASAGPSASAAPQVPDSPAVPAYDFSQPAPEREAVDNSYFTDAAFVGDSRTDGFMLYSGVGTGKNLTSNGLSIFKLDERKSLTVGDKEYTLLEALALEEYGKVYLCLGINELGIYRDNDFYESYCSAIDQIRRVQPNAVIYIQGLIPVNISEVENYNGNKYGLSNDHLRVYNDLMRQAAEEKQVVYLDLFSAFADENGELPQGASRDGVHLGKDACMKWLDYLKTHTVDFDVLYPNGPPAMEPTQPDQPAEPPAPAQPDTSTADGSVSG
ncbi:MAG: hypothetical protein HFF44_00015 [Lawsonibacter sp.]|nr:hypothetical protein [Lawsonibacter sp.]